MTQHSASDAAAADVDAHAEASEAHTCMANTVDSAGRNSLIFFSGVTSHEVEFSEIGADGLQAI